METSVGGSLLNQTIYNTLFNCVPNIKEMLPGQIVAFHVQIYLQGLLVPN